MNNKLPLHIGIIMDGNGRYAQMFGKPRSWGHQEGAKNLKKLTKYIFKKNIKYLSVYAFSTENFKRPKEEVDYLMNLFISMFTHDFTFLLKENVKVVFSGRKKDLPLKVIKAMHEMEEKSKNNTSATFNVCLNYGAQDEMVDAVYKISQKVLKQELKLSEITKEVVEDNLYQKLPPLDLVIRTSGEQRLSNFMLWQSSYAEFYFPKCHFPEFDEKEFDKALEAYASRDRRFGNVSK